MSSQPQRQLTLFRNIKNISGCLQLRGDSMCKTHVKIFFPSNQCIICSPKRHKTCMIRKNKCNCSKLNFCFLIRNISKTGYFHSRKTRCIRNLVSKFHYQLHNFFCRSIIFYFIRQMVNFLYNSLKHYLLQTIRTRKIQICQYRQNKSIYFIKPALFKA